MNLTRKISALCAAALLAAPLAVLADSSTDRQIERDAMKNMPSNIASKVTVSVEDSVATVTGTVYSDSQRSIAIAAVKQVPDVKDVNDDLKVGKGRSDSSASATAESGEHHSDKWIALKVKSELLVHSNVSATHTDVNVVDGVVTLSGTAKTEAEKELTEQYAKGVEGVRGVHNEIQIRDANSSTTTVSANDTAPSSTFAGDSKYTAGERIDDSAITTKVKFALAKHHSTSAMKTSVHTQDGVVYIAGNADNAAERDLVTKLAQGVPGVATVHNDMTVQNP
jgi:hyperosmotically inducible protein